MERQEGGQAWCGSCVQPPTNSSSCCRCLLREVSQGTQRKVGLLRQPWGLEGQRTQIGRNQASLVLLLMEQFGYLKNVGFNCSKNSLQGAKEMVT